MMMFPRPAKAERGTARAKRHLALVAQQPCIICSSWPVEVHHAIMGRFSQRKASDFETIPLCPDHHRELHASPAAWRKRYGRTDFELIPLTLATMETE